MKKGFWFSAIIVLVIGVFLSGCGAITTYTFEKERVDQELRGNRGALTGSPPPPPSNRKTTREIFGIDIELPLMREITTPVKKYVKKKADEKPPTIDKTVYGNRGFLSGGGARPAEEAPRAEKPTVMQRIKEKFTAPKEEAKTPAAEPESSYMLYKVQEGDTLGKIAGRDDIYGDTAKWTVIYDANRDKLKSPSRIYPGQILRIPGSGGASEGDEGAEK